MKVFIRSNLLSGLLLVALCVLSQFSLAASSQMAKDPLPSWREGEAKQSIINFVKQVTTTGHSDFVPEQERIATFDNDGTLWAEQPVYFQALFIFDRIKAMAPQHPEWKKQEPFASVLKGDIKKALESGAIHSHLQKPWDMEKLELMLPMKE